MLRNAFAVSRAAALTCLLLFLAACGSGTSGTPFSILTNSLTSGVVGIPYSATITAANGAPPYTFAVTSGTAPAGLNLSSSGVLAGTPTAVATSSFSVTATDARSNKVSQTYRLTVTAVVLNPLTILTSSVPAGTVGVAYSTTISAVNGTTPYTFSILSGNASWLSISSAGVLSGTPAAAGNFTVTVQVTDAKGQVATAFYTLVVNAAGSSPVSIATNTIPSGTVQVPYTTSINAMNGTSPYTFTLAPGSANPPANVSLTTGGVLTGTPTTAGSFPFTVMVTDAKGGTATQLLTLTIASATPQPVSISTTAVSSGTVGSPYASTILAVNGTTPYSFSLSGNPAWMSITAAGVLTGTPTTAGDFPFTVMVTDATGAPASRMYTVVIAAAGTTAVNFTTKTVPGGTVNVAYTPSLGAANGTAPYTFSSSGSLPPGVNLGPGGSFSGVPSTAGNYTFKVTVTDANGLTASEALTVHIAGPATAVSLPASTLPQGRVGTPYYTNIVAAGGATPYYFVQAGGSLPAGITVSPVGVLSGTPTASGSFNFNMTVADNNGQQATKPYTLTIAALVASPMIATTALPGGAVAVPYSATVIAANGTPPYTFTAPAGSTPAWLNVAPSGVLSGTPTASGSFNFTVTVTDSAANTASAPFTLAVAASGPLTLTLGPATLPVAVAGSSYTAPLQIDGGTPPYTITTTGGLPSGINLSTSGVLTGSTSTVGTFSFSAKVVDSASPAESASATISLSVVTATVAIDTTNVLATVPQSFFGMHTSVYDTSLNDVSRLPALLQTSGITTLRYPGGSYADRYHWAQFSLTPLYASPTPACSTLSPGFLGAGSDFGSFVKTLLATGTQALITVNYGTSVASSTASLSAGSQGVANHCSEPNTAGQPQEAAAWVAYANGDPASTQVIGVDAAGFDWKYVGFWAGLRAASPISPDDGYNFLRIGHAAPLGIKNWELGNEMYYNGWSDNRNFEADLHAPYIYPSGYSGTYNSRAYVDALTPTAYGTNANTFFQAMKAVDPTIQVGIGFASPGATDPIVLEWDPDLVQALCASTSFDFAVIHYYPGTYNAVQPGELLSLPESDLPRQIAYIKSTLAQACPASTPPPFWLTETSPNGNLATGFPAPVTGLFALNEYLTALDNGVQNIDWLELHNSTFLDESENPEPAFYGIQLAHLLAGVGDSVVSAQSSSPGVLSFATRKTGAGQTGVQTGVLLVNANSSTSAVVQVTVSGATLGFSATEYSYGLSTSQSTTLPATSFAIPGNSFPVTVPPYTAIELIVP
jgi:hypothetical protein